MKKLFTVCCPIEGNRVLLGYKKRGFGAGKWNGFGGKVEPSEDVFVAAHRELDEEARISCPDMALIGLLAIRFEDGRPHKDVFMFHGGRVVGEPLETEEMRPEWFRTDDLPFDEMLMGDRLWFSMLLGLRPFIGSWVCNDPDVIVSCEVREVSLAELHARVPAT